MQPQKGTTLEPMGSVVLSQLTHLPLGLKPIAGSVGIRLPLELLYRIAVVARLQQQL